MQISLVCSRPHYRFFMGCRFLAYDFILKMIVPEKHRIKKLWLDINESRKSFFSLGLRGGVHAHENTTIQPLNLFRTVFREYQFLVDSFDPKIVIGNLGTVKK